MKISKLLVELLWGEDLTQNFNINLNVLMI